MKISRKEFLDRSTKIAAAAILSPLALHARELSPERKIRIALIGCGSVSRMYFPHLLKSPFVDLVCCCDIIPERAKTAAEKFKIFNLEP